MEKDFYLLIFKKNLFTYIVCLFFLLLTHELRLFAQQTGTNSDVMKPYKPPDVYNSTGKVIKLDKLDLNKANFQQLLALPEINEDLALKIIRRRPLKYLNDLEKLPYINENRMKIIIKGLSNLVTQQYADKEQDHLKQ